LKSGGSKTGGIEDRRGETTRKAGDSDCRRLRKYVVVASTAGKSSNCPGGTFSGHARERGRHRWNGSVLAEQGTCRPLSWLTTEEWIALSSTPPHADRRRSVVDPGR